MFGNADAHIKAVITADDKASKTLQDFGDEAGKMSAKLKAGLFAAGAAAVAFGVSSVKAFTESQDMIAQTNAVLKSTGGIAGVTSDQVTKLATSLQKVTKFSDEEVRGGENLLLTFTKIGKDIFPQATEAMLNMSTALGQDVKSSAIQLGKALQDPILGVTALRRVGVNFNDAARETIKNMVETGHQAEAQKFILQELNTEFGNSARAAGETFAGKLAILKNRFNDVQEAIGQFIVNSLFGLMAGMQNVWNAIQPVVEAVGNFLRPAIQALINTIEQELLPALQNLYVQLSPGMIEVLKFTAIVIGGILVVAFRAAIDITNALVRAISVAATVVGFLVNAFQQAAGPIIGVSMAILGAFRAAFNGIAYAWNHTVGALSFHAPKWIPGIGGSGFDVPDIPTLAQGGIVTKPTMALIGEAGPEAVVPLNKGMGMNITINAQAFMGSQIEARKFAKMIMDSYNDAMSAKNQTVINYT